MLFVFWLYLIGYRGRGGGGGVGGGGGGGGGGTNIIDVKQKYRTSHRKRESI